jgi:hypothetical protein
MNEKNNLTGSRPPGDATNSMNQDEGTLGVTHQELAYKIKGAIDQRGRYSYKLSDMASGLAAGTGKTQAEARQVIEDEFKKQTGHSPMDYLERQYAIRKQNEQNRGNSRGQGR